MFKLLACGGDSFKICVKGFPHIQQLKIIYLTVCVCVIDLLCYGISVTNVTNVTSVMLLLCIDPSSTLLIYV